MTSSSRRRSTLGTWLATLAALALLAAALAAVLLRVARTQGIEEATARAGAWSEGRDRVALLIVLAGAEEAPLADRNRAVWALGELRDERALPVLERLHVQETCDHGRLVCQREVRKATGKIHADSSFRGPIRAAWRAVRDRLARATGLDDHPPLPREPG